jgi:hypothetical protein
MNVREVFPPSAPPEQRVDFNDLAALTTALILASDQLAGMSGSVAQARGIREYDSDRRKRALALPAREFIATGDSATAAETKARASVAYGETLDQLQMDLTAAEKCIADHEAARVKWESIRSALAVLRATSSNL